jgi:hypothetical protein
MYRKENATRSFIAVIFHWVNTFQYFGMKTYTENVESEAFTDGVMKTFIFCDITPCSPVKVKFPLSGLNGIISQKVELFSQL